MFFDPFLVRVDLGDLAQMATSSGVCTSVCFAPLLKAESMDALTINQAVQRDCQRERERQKEGIAREIERQKRKGEQSAMISVS